MRACKNGRHVWDKGPAAGSKCRKCKSPYRGRGRPPAPTSAPKPARAPAPRDPLVDQAAADDLNAALGGAAEAVVPGGTAAPGGGGGVAPPAAVVQEAAQPAAVVLSPDDEDVRSTADWMGRRLGKMFVGVTDLALEKLAKREPGDCDEEDEVQFAKGLGRIFRSKWDDSPLSPMAQVLVSGSLIVGEKWMTSSPLPQKPKLVALSSVKLAPSPPSPPAAPATDSVPVADSDSAESPHD